MSTEGPVSGCSGTAPAPAQDALPVDLLLEIIALADVATVVRFTATGKILRRAILDPAFWRRLALAARDSFNPALLLAVSYREQVYGGCVTTHRLIHSPGPTKLCARLDDHSLSDSFEPVASGDGLLVLRRQGGRPDDDVEVRVRNIFTGHVTSLPPTTLPNASACLHVVLISVGDAGRSFELLVADMNRPFYRTFSSKDSQWSAIRQVSVPYSSSPWHSNCPAVIGRTVYLPRCGVNACHWNHVLALDVDSGEATMMELPPACFSRMMAIKREAQLLLATVGGRLRVLVAESDKVVMWTLTDDAATWSRQVVISNLEIARRAGLPVSFTLLPLSFIGFGERTGAIILHWEIKRKAHFLRLDLGTKEDAAPLVVTRLTSPENAGRFARFFLHEIDLASLLQTMKSF